MSSNSNPTYTRNSVRKELAENRISISADAADRIVNSPNTRSIIETIISEENTNVTVDLLDEITNSDGETNQGVPHTDSRSTDIPDGPSASPAVQPGEDPPARIAGAVEVMRQKQQKADHSVERFVTDENQPLSERWDTVYEKLTHPDFQYTIASSCEEASYPVDGDITGQSRTEGKAKDFIQLFRDRKQKISRILSGRVSSANISNLTQSRYKGSEVSVLGIVKQKRMSQNQNPILILEDESGEIPVVFASQDDSDEFETHKAVRDSIIGVKGTLSQDGNIIFGDTLHFPDIPRSNSTSSASRNVEAAFISDVHFGSQDFAYSKWQRFIEWTHNRENLDYLFIAGDLVEGIGVYPGQEEELDVPNINDQIRLAAQTLRQLPDDLQIICSVGNHDPVRLSEPQPTFAEKYKEHFAPNVQFVGNPSYVTVESVTTLLYHGMSIHPLSENVRGFDPEEPIDAMRLMLKLRHLAPIYGENVRLAPESEDYLAVTTVPDIFHTGHVHQYGDGTFRNVKLFNTASWQHQTSFQKQKGIQPDVGVFPTVNLQKMNWERISL